MESLCEHLLVRCWSLLVYSHNLFHISCEEKDTKTEFSCVYSMGDKGRNIVYASSKIQAFLFTDSRSAVITLVPTPASLILFATNNEVIWNSQPWKFDPFLPSQIYFINFGDASTLARSVWITGVYGIHHAFHAFFILIFQFLLYLYSVLCVPSARTCCHGSLAHIRETRDQGTKVMNTNIL